VASVNDVRTRISAKEDELTSKSTDEAPGETVESEAEEVSADADATDSTQTTT